MSNCWWESLLYSSPHPIYGFGGSGWDSREDYWDNKEDNEIYWSQKGDLTNYTHWVEYEIEEE